MKKVLFRCIEQHINDGMLLMAARLLRQQEEFRDTYEYYYLFVRLMQQAFQMAQNIGPVNVDIYRELITLNFPHLKGGVFNE